MTAQRKFQTSAHANAADGCDDRLGAVLDAADKGQQIRLGDGLRSTEFADIRSAGEPRRRSNQHDCRDGRIRIGFFQALNERLPQFQPQAVDRRIVEFYDRDPVSYFQASLCHAHSLFHYAELGSAFRAANVTAWTIL
jgi:hypothetical protein